MTFATVAFLFWTALFAFSGSEVQALTNAEFFNLVKPYISDLRNADEKTDDGNVDVIELPGGPDDELDVMRVFERLGLLEQLDDATLKANTKREETSRHLKRLGLEGKCSCQKDRCKCCLSHQFSLLTYNFGLDACLEVAYLLHSTGFEVTITVNGHQLYHNRMELNRPPRLCYSLPILSVVKGCFEVYDIDLRTKKMCGKLTLEISTRLKTFRWNYDLGCFRIPLLEGSKLDQIIFDPNSLTVDVVRNDLNKHNVRSGMDKARNVIELFRELHGILESQLEDVVAMPDLEPELQNDTK